MSMRIISSIDEFKAFEPDWNLVYAASQDCDAFLTHRWLQLWFEHFGENSELFILVWEENGQAQAIAPLIIGKERKWRMQWRVLRLPLRESAGPLRSNFLLGQRPQSAMDTFIKFIRSKSDQWDVALLEGLPAQGESIEYLSESAACHGLKYTEEGSVGPARYMTVTQPWEDYVRTRSSHMRKRLNQERSRLDREGEWSYQKIDVVHHLQSGLDAIHQILQKRYHVNATNLLPTEDQRTLHFFDALCKRFGIVDMLDFRLLIINQQPAACLISLINQGKVYPLLTKYDPAFDAASPGRAIFMALFTEAQNCNYQEIDFLSDWEYLSRFTDDTRDFIRVRLLHRGWRASLYTMLEQGEQLRIRYAEHQRLKNMAVKDAS